MSMPSAYPMFVSQHPGNSLNSQDAETEITYKRCATIFQMNFHGSVKTIRAKLKNESSSINLKSQVSFTDLDVPNTKFSPDLSCWRQIRSAKFEDRNYSIMSSVDFG